MSKPKIIYTVGTSFVNYRDESDEVIDERTFESEKDAKKYADVQIEKCKAEAKEEFPTRNFTVHRFANGGGYIDEDDTREHEYCICIGKTELIPDSEKKKKPPKHIYALVGDDDVVTKFTYRIYGLADYYDNNDGSIAIILNCESNRRNPWNKEKYGKSKTVTDTRGNLYTVYTNPAMLL